MRKEYIRKGQCIFCGKSNPEVTFYTRPHTTPHSLGSNRIGFDVCDECNHFFGTPDKTMIPKISVETSVKEIFGVIRFMLNLEREGHENDRLKSIYFNFWRDRNTLQIKPSFNRNSSFNRVFIKQFKRGLYELFLQEFHLLTERGLEKEFDRVRKFARYGEGDLSVWHLQTRMILLGGEMDMPELRLTRHDLDMIDKYGFYAFYLWGFWFYLEVTPVADMTRDVYLRDQANKMGVGGFVVNKMVELRDIDDIDYTLRQLYRGHS